MKRCLLLVVLLAVVSPVSGFNISGYVNDAQNATGIIGNVSVNQNDLTYYNTSLSTGFYYISNMSANTSLPITLNATADSRFQYKVVLETPNINSDISLNISLIPTNPQYHKDDALQYLAAIIGVAREGNNITHDNNITFGWGNPIQNAAIYLYNQSLVNQIFTVTTNNAGFYNAQSFDGIPLVDGFDYTIVPSKSGFYNSEPHVVTMHRNDTIFSNDDGFYSSYLCAFPTGDPQDVVLIMGNTTWRSKDNGINWKVYSGKNPFHLAADPICAQFSDKSVIIAGGYAPYGGFANCSFGSVSNETWVTYNNGTTWDLLNTTHTAWNTNRNLTQRIGALAAVTSNDLLVMTGGYVYSDCFGSTEYLHDSYVSSDRGNSWVVTNSSNGLSLKSDLDRMVAVGTDLYIFSDSTHRIYKSTNYGANWNNISVMPAIREYAGITTLSDGAIIMGGGLNNTVSPYVSTNDTWETSNGGITWNKRANAQWVARYKPAGFVTMPDDSIIIVGGSYYDTGAVIPKDTWRSTDRGVTWTNMSGLA